MVVAELEELTSEQVGELLNVGAAEVRRLRREGRIKGRWTRLGYFFPPDVVAEYLSALPSRESQPRSDEPGVARPSEPPAPAEHVAVDTAYVLRMLDRLSRQGGTS